MTGGHDMSYGWAKDADTHAQQRSEVTAGTIMDAAAVADRRALFSALQAALMTIADLYYAVERPYGPELSVFLERTRKALEVGAPYGSPEQIASTSVVRDVPEEG